MICQRCRQDFLESEIQLSHDVPIYIGGVDSDGRHNLCKKCHDIYEKKIFAVMTIWLPEETKKTMKEKAKSFAKLYFKKEGDDVI